MKYLGFIFICCSLTTLYSQNNNTLKFTDSPEYALGQAIIDKDVKKASELLKQPNINVNYRMDVSTRNTLFKDNHAPLLALALFYYNNDETIIDTLRSKGANPKAPVQPVNCDHEITVAAFSLHCRHSQRANNKPCLLESLVDELLEHVPEIGNY